MRQHTRTGYMFAGCLLLSLAILPMAGAEEREFSPAYKDVMNTLEKLTPTQEIEIRMGTEKDQYDIGDLFELRFQVDTECHIILMDISTNGDIAFLAPSAFVPETTVSADAVYSTLEHFNMPPITIAEPVGEEIVNLFCSSERIDLFEADFEKEPIYTITPDDDERLASFAEQLKKLDQFKWSGTSVTFKIGATPRARAMLKTTLGARGALPPIGATGTAGKFFPAVGATGTAGKVLPPVGSTGTTGHTDDDTPGGDQPE